MPNTARSAVVGVAFAASTLTPVANAAELVGISFPETVTLSVSTAANGPRSVVAPFDFGGIGNIVNPTVAGPGSIANANDFTLHQTVGVVNVTDVVVTYEFDMPVLIDAFDIVQHHNGVRTLELLVGDSLGSLVSAGQVSVPENALEYAVNRFDFDAMASGRFVQLRLIEPELDGQGGWALYRAYPVLVPSPGVACVFAVGGLATVRRRRV
ncbi:unnamed protein product [Symbiodinium necroappetens]|uniref:PEP-CTERM protein-sorting domain-containing protein n=1 Tax=Symbiodinium necroappetens TaxID=1628268 RepID=A0A812ITA2_9DINO|nr:unnamed protein product [Symbiodinium necroappetens]